jgi:hypothetical protein
MGTIADYTGGFILESIRKALHFFDSTEGALTQDEKGIRLQKNIKEFEPLILSFNQAAEYIRNAKSIAIGERVCRALRPQSLFTESVFLDELAVEMTAIGHARMATIDEAEECLQKSAGHPLIISKVSGEYLEICPSSPPDCVYWRAEKRGLHCLHRKI